MVKLSNFLNITKEEIMRYIVTLLIGAMAGNLPYYYPHIFDFFKNIDYVWNALYIGMWIGVILLISTVKFLILSFKEKEKRIIDRLMLSSWTGGLKKGVRVSFDENLCMSMADVSSSHHTLKVAKFLPEKYDIFSRIKFFLLKMPMIFKSTEYGEIAVSIRLQKMGLAYALVFKNQNGGQRTFWQELKNASAYL